MISYFKPKKLEHINGKSIYPAIGVRFFKRYILLTDLLMFRLRKKQQLNMAKNELLNELNRLDWQTRRDETIHIFAMAAIAILVAKNYSAYSFASLTIIFFINLYANIYPIFIQRYNRYRILQIMRFANFNTPYD